jgi:hypothetical protein
MLDEAERGAAKETRNIAAEAFAGVLRTGGGKKGRE